jgi:hypothetical protein
LPRLADRPPSRIFRLLAGACIRDGSGVVG